MLVIAILSVDANSQTDFLNQQADSAKTTSLEKEILREDSLYTIILRDSLHLSSQAISSILLTKQNYKSQVAQITANNSLSEFQKADAHHVAVVDADTQIKRLMGGIAYKKYIEILFPPRMGSQ